MISVDVFLESILFIFTRAANPHTSYGWLAKHRTQLLSNLFLLVNLCGFPSSRALNMVVTVLRFDPGFTVGFFLSMGKVLLMAAANSAMAIGLSLVNPACVQLEHLR